MSGRYDILVVGGGPSGLAAAIAASRRGGRVAVVSEARGGSWPRAEMLPPAAATILGRLGVRNSFANAQPLGPSRSLWGSDTPEWHGHGMDGHAPSVSIDRTALERELEMIAAAAGVERFDGRVGKVSGRPGEWHVQTNTCDTMDARFLIDATGRQAAIARRLGARLQCGPTLVARLKTFPNLELAGLVVEAMPDGWWYGLPHPAGGSTVACLGGPASPADDSYLMGLRYEDMAGALRLDARSARLSHVVGEAWLGVGDAACAYDPVSSQGLFDALSSGFFGGNAAIDALDGRMDALSTYATLVERTAMRTHMATPRHYAQSRHHSAFWAEHGQPFLDASSIESAQISA